VNGYRPHDVSMEAVLEKVSMGFQEFCAYECQTTGFADLVSYHVKRSRYLMCKVSCFPDCHGEEL
jgi:hypothetical protein